MARYGRQFRQAEGKTARKKTYYPYKNEYEYELSKLLRGWEYEDKAAAVDYIVPKTYNPDFTNNKHPWLLIEAKGIFLGGKEEARKYVEMRRCNPDKEVFFIFEDPMKKAYQGCKRRIDGSILTLAEWASSNNFPFCHCTEIPPWLVDSFVTTEELRARIEALKLSQAKVYGGRKKCEKIRKRR